MQDKKQYLELHMEKQTDSKLGKEFVKAVCCHPVYLTSMQTTSCKMPGWMNTSWNQDWREKYQQPIICRWHHFDGRKWRGTKDLLDKGERGEWKSYLKTQHSRNKNHGIWSHHFMANREKMETVTNFIFLGCKITMDSDFSHDAYSLEEKLGKT